MSLVTATPSTTNVIPNTNTNAQSSIPKSNNKNVGVAVLPHKDFFEDLTKRPPSLITDLATSIFEMTPKQTAESRDKFFSLLKEAILEHHRMSGEIKTLTEEVNKIAKEQSLARSNEVFSPKKARKECLKGIKELMANVKEFYRSLENQFQNLSKEKDGLSASVRLSLQQEWDEPERKLNWLYERFGESSEMISNYILKTGKEIEDLEKEISKQVSEWKEGPISECPRLSYLDTKSCLDSVKRLRDNLTYYYVLGPYQLKAAKWKLTQLHLVDSVFPKIKQLAMDVEAFKPSVDQLKNMINSGQVIQVENELLKSVQHYNELSDEVKRNLIHIESLKKGATEYQKQMEMIKTVDIYDLQTKAYLSQEIEKILTVTQKEQVAAFDSIKSAWETIELFMGSDTKIPGLTSRFWGTQKSITYEINRLHAATKSGSLPKDSTEGYLWSLKDNKKVISPFEPRVPEEKKN